MMKKVTMRDVAREAGVSVATVSYVINNRKDGRISDKTRKKVLQIINLLNYSPNQSAKALSTNKSGNIALFIDGSHAGQLAFALKLSEALQKRGYHLLLVPPSHTGTIDNADAIIAKDVDKETFHTIGDNNLIPLLAVDSEIDHPLFFQVTSVKNDEGTMDRKIEKLLDCLTLAVDHVQTDEHHFRI